MNLGQAKEKAIKLINEYSNNANIISASDPNRQDYTLRMNDSANDAQNEIATVKRIPAVHSISQAEIPNQLPRLTSFDLKQHFATDITYIATGSKAYYFEVDKPATVVIEEQIAGVWTEIETLTITGITSFTTYSGLISPSSATNLVRLRFSGSYPYNIRNVALYFYTFASASDVPAYRPWVKYDLPTNFYMLNKIVNQTDPRQYVNLQDYKFEDRRTFLFNYFMTGSFDIHYYKYPTTITTATADSYEFEVDQEAQEAIPYKMGALAVMDENDTVSKTLLALYQGKLINLTLGRVSDVQQVQNTLWSASSPQKLY